jgi:voltage-gated potassium channel Kch
VRIFPFLRRHGWFFLSGLVALSLALAYVGLDHSFRATGVEKSPLDLFYLVLQMWRLVSSPGVSTLTWELQIARFLIPALMFYALAYLTLVLFYERAKIFSLRLSNDHIVICGLGLLGTILVKRFCEQGYEVVVIERDNKAEGIDRCKEGGAVILIGDATDPEILMQAQIASAKYLISVLGKDDLNAEVAGHAYDLVRQVRKIPLNCYIHIVDPRLCNLLRTVEIRSTVGDAFRLEFFNIYQTAGRAILQSYPAFSRVSGDPPSVHILLVGAGRTGESLLLQATKLWREYYGAGSARLNITIIDTEASQKKATLQVRYPPMERYCEIRPLDIEITSEDFIRGDYLFDDLGNCIITHVYICMSDDSLGLAAMITLQEHLKKYTIPIVVRTNDTGGIATLLREIGKTAEEFTNLYTYPLVDMSCRAESILNTTHEVIAQAIHAEYLALNQRHGFQIGTNPALVPWDHLPENLRESTRAQADHIIRKLHAISCDVRLATNWDESLYTFTDEEVELLARMEHERWMAERLNYGWTHGPARDDDQKIHPSLVPWDQLSEMDKEKDRNPVRTLPQVLMRVDLKIVHS